MRHDRIDVLRDHALEAVAVTIGRLSPAGGHRRQNQHTHRGREIPRNCLKKSIHAAVLLLRSILRDRLVVRGHPIDVSDDKHLDGALAGFDAEAVFLYSVGQERHRV